jgi:hypothetical protein
MALINCPECNKQISDKANICVGCGAPVVIDLPQSNFKSDATVAEERPIEDHTSLNTSSTLKNMRKAIYGFFFVLIIIIFGFFLAGGPSSSITQIFETTLTPPTNNTDYINIIGKPIKFGNIEVAQYHFPVKMNWEDANKACADLGEGWKLPNRDELDYLYQNRVAIGGFASFVYWSSTEFDIVSHAWYQYFVNGLQNYTNKSKTNYVRAVRTF